MRSDDLTLEEIYALADVFVEIHSKDRGVTELRDQFAKLIIDTEMIIRGRLPIEAWTDPDE